MQHVEGPLLPDRSFESSDWTNSTARYPLLILEYVDGGLENIYGPYTTTADMMAAYRYLTYPEPDEEYDDGYSYDLQPLKGRVR